MRFDLLRSSVGGVQLLYALNLAAVGAATLAGAVVWGWAEAAVVAGLYALMNCCGAIIAYHRFHAHRAFRFRHPALEWLFTLLGALSGTGSPIGWVLIHQDHHAHSDGPRDPHAPRRGLWRVMTFDYPYDRNRWAVRRLIRSPAHVRLHDWYFGVLAAYAATLFAAGGVEWAILGFSAPSAAVMTAQGLTNYVNHLPGVGYRNLETREHSRNVWWMALLNFGEGWHNNHHARPTAATTRLNWWEIDPAGLVIGLVGRVQETRP